MNNTTTPAGITLSTEGRRVYICGNSYPVKDQIKSAGGKWDADRKQWWIGVAKKSELESALAKAPAPSTQGAEEKYDGEVRGKAEYKGRSYFIRAEGTNDRGAWFRLVDFSGTRSFFAPASEVNVTKRYQAREPRRNFYGRGGFAGRAEYPTLRGIRNFAEGVKSGRIQVCSMCGKSNCESLTGHGLCEND